MKKYYLIVILVLWITGSCKGPDQIEVVPAAISYIMVYNRGDYSNYDRRRISNRDSINQICGLLNSAKQVSLDSINLKLSRRFAGFNIYNAQDDRIAQLSYDITMNDGNIIWYKGSWFRSDSLDLLLR